MADTLITVDTPGRITLPGSDEAFVVPSGQAVTLHEVIVDQPAPGAVIYRFRFLAPAITRDGGTMDFEASIADMQQLCDTYAVQHLTAPLPETVQVIIAFSDKILPFGETDPDTTQFFMPFAIENGVCVLEPF